MSESEQEWLGSLLYLFQFQVLEIVITVLQFRHGNGGDLIIFIRFKQNVGVCLKRPVRPADDKSIAIMLAHTTMEFR